MPNPPKMMPDKKTEAGKLDAAISPSALSASGKAVDGAGSRNERDLVRIASGSTALAFGVALGSLQSLRHDAAGFSFQLSFGTAVAFAIGAVIGLLYWKLVTRSATRGASPLLRAASFLLLLGGVGAFLYPLRFLPAEKLPDVYKGLAIAAVALSLIGFILWRIKRFLDQDSARNESPSPIK